MMYKLISLKYNDSHDHWEVYGHFDIGDNKSLGEFKTELEAFQQAHSYRPHIPVIYGGHASVDALLSALPEQHWIASYR